MAGQTPRRAWFLLRISLGWIFLWAFLDKLFGLGFSTAANKSWLAGGSPTTGFLASAAKGPFAALFNAMAGNAAVDVLFILGLLVIGLGLLLGIGRKIVTASGVLLMLLMWLAILPKQTNTFIDDHIIYIFALLLLNRYSAGEFWGLGGWWKSLGLVKRFKWLE